jgi:hypothetical protein
VRAQAGIESTRKAEGRMQVENAADAVKRAQADDRDAPGVISEANETRRERSLAVRMITSRKW